MSKIISFLERIYQTALIGLVVLLPIVFIPVPWATLPHAKVMLVIILAGIGVIAFALARFLEGTISFPKNWVMLTGILLPIAYFVSALATDPSRFSFVGAGVDIHTVSMMFFWAVVVILAALVFRGRVQLIRIQYAFLISAGVVILFQLTRLFFGPEVLSFGIFTGSATSVVGVWHDLAIFLGLALFFAAAFLSHTTHTMGTTTKWSMWTILVPSFFLLVVINAYDVWVGLAALFAAVIVYHVIQWFYSDAAARTVKNLFQNIYLFFVLGLLSLVFVFFGVSIHDALPDKLRVDSLEVRPSWTGTLEIASQTLEGKNALFGSGPNTFVRQWGLYKPAGVNETAFWNADFAQGIGFIPTTIVITGIIGALAWILFLLGFVYENGRVLLKSSPDIRQFVMPLVAGVVYLWTLAIVYPPGIVIITLAFLFTGALVGWGIHAGVVTSYTRAVSDAPRIGPAWSVLLVLIVLISLVVSVFVLRTVVSDMLVNRGISIHNTRQDINAARASIERALVIDSGNDRAYRAALELGIIQISALAASANSADSEALIELQTTISNTIQHGLTAVSQDKNNYQNWISLARIYEQLVGAQVEGAYKNAEQAYQQAIAENPTNPLFYFRLAQLAVVQNDIAKAEGYLQQTLSLKPNYAEALFVLSQVQVAQGDMDTAILTARNTVQAASREPVAWFQLGTLLHQVEKYNEAAEALEQAVFLNSNYANALYMLGLTYAQLDRTVEAKNTLERVRTLNPNNTQVEQALANLAEAREASSDSTENTEQ